MLDNTALTLILVTLNVLWFFLLTAAVIYTWLAYDITKTLQRERRELRRQLDLMPTGVPKTRGSYRDHMDEATAIVNAHDYPTR